jgi:hypothetical protein
LEKLESQFVQGIRRTAVLGGHLDVCAACGHDQPSYNSCRNRHCPKCQSLAQARWIDKRLERLLPVRYFHVVFTLPAELRSVAARYRQAVFDLLFAAASQTLLALAQDPKRLDVVPDAGSITVACDANGISLTLSEASDGVAEASATLPVSLTITSGAVTLASNIVVVASLQSVVRPNGPECGPTCATYTGTATLQP